MKFLIIILMLIILPSDSTKVVKKAKSFNKMTIEQKQRIIKRNERILDSLLYRKDTTKVKK